MTCAMKFQIEYTKNEFSCKSVDRDIVTSPIVSYNSSKNMYILPVNFIMYIFTSIHMKTCVQEGTIS